MKSWFNCTYNSAQDVFCGSVKASVKLAIFERTESCRLHVEYSVEVQNLEIKLGTIEKKSSYICSTLKANNLEAKWWWLGTPKFRIFLEASLIKIGMFFMLHHSSYLPYDFLKYWWLYYNAMCSCSLRQPLSDVIKECKIVSYWIYNYIFVPEEGSTNEIFHLRHKTILNKPSLFSMHFLSLKSPMFYSLEVPNLRPRVAEKDCLVCFICLAFFQIPIAGLTLAASLTISRSIWLQIW